MNLSDWVLDSDSDPGPGEARKIKVEDFVKLIKDMIDASEKEYSASATPGSRFPLYYLGRTDALSELLDQIENWGWEETRI